MKNENNNKPKTGEEKKADLQSGDKWSAPTSSYDDAKAIMRMIKKVEKGG